ncbi:MAG TPA: hypothetical protein VFQ61_03830 [Polyangiaceae bacterium]|nr:hypothetical protein [Polyangiaceae bacterium]
MLTHAQDALVWTERLMAACILQQTLELWLIRRQLRDDGVFAFPVLRREYRLFPAPLRLLCDWGLNYPAFTALLGLRVAGAWGLALGVSEFAVPLWLSQVAVCVRFRGTFNGGSDYMTVQVLLALGTATVLRSSVALTGGLFYIAVQSTFSYFIAGVAKAKEADFWSGRAVLGFVKLPQYAAPSWAKRVLSIPPVRRISALAVLLFECGFPLAWMGPKLALAWLATGATFHLVNFFVFGLNRFFFVWLATYPALLFSVQKVAAG